MLCALTLVWAPLGCGGFARFGVHLLAKFCHCTCDIRIQWPRHTRMLSEESSKGLRPASSPAGMHFCQMRPRKQLLPSCLTPFDGVPIWCNSGSCFETLHSHIQPLNHLVLNLQNKSVDELSQSSSFCILGMTSRPVIANRVSLPQVLERMGAM